MNLYETIQDIEELRTLCKEQSDTIQGLRKSLDFENDVRRNLKEQIASFDYKVKELEDLVDFYRRIVEYFLESR